MVVSPSRTSGGSPLSPSITLVMPSTPFMGVRISWLMVARNSLLVRLAVSAAARAAVISVLRRSSSSKSASVCRS
jgi:hypothetical protein